MRLLGQRFSFAYLMALCLIVSFPALNSHAGVKESLSLFVEFAPEDSIVSISRKGLDKLELKLENTSSRETRTVNIQVPSKAIEKLEVEAKSEEIAFSEDEKSFSFADSVLEEKAKSAPELTSQSVLRKNRWNYVVTQTLFSDYLYAIALPVSLNITSDKIAAVQLLALPVSFFTHMYTTRNRDIYQSHLWSTSYLSASSLYLSYGSSFLLLGGDFNSFRLGSFAAMAAYPFSLYQGFQHGDRYLNNPGRVMLQSSFSASSVWTSAFFIPLWAQYGEASEAKFRIATAQLLASGILGHFASGHYANESTVPGGIGPGIFSHTVFGTLVGGSIISLFATEEFNATAFSALMGGGAIAGFAEGLWFFSDKNDTYERSQYLTLGSFAGATIPMAIAILADGGFPERAILPAVTGAAMGGYAITRMITRDLVEEKRSLQSEDFSLKMNPVPQYEPYRAGDDLAWRWKADLLTISFR